MYTWRVFICGLIRAEEAAYVVYGCDSNWTDLSAALGGYVYAVGGFLAGAAGPTERYDPATNTWTRLASANLGFWYFHGAVAVLNGQIWACGGTKGNGTCQILDTATNSWIGAPTMNEPRSVIFNSKSPRLAPTSILHTAAQFSDIPSVWLH